MFDQRHGQPGLIQRIHQRQHFAAGNAKGMAAALFVEPIGDHR